MTGSAHSVDILRETLRTNSPVDGAVPRVSVMARVRRAVGWLCMFIAALGVVLAILLTATGQSFSVAVGQLWFDLDASSLNGAQAGIQRYLLPTLWDGLIVPVLQSTVWRLLLIMVLGGGLLGVALLSMPWRIRVGWPTGKRSRYHARRIFYSCPTSRRRRGVAAVVWHIC